MNLPYIAVYKKQGQTPLEVIDNLKEHNKEWANLPMTYAGRLDPMAEGLLVILIGEECKNKEKYLGADKTYEFEILFGFETDTFDLLGIINTRKELFLEKSSDLLAKNCLTDIEARPDIFKKEFFSCVLDSFTGKQIQKYPVYSSKNLNKDITVETTSSHEIEIYSLELLESCTISKKDLEKSITDKIKSVNPNADFRQSEIIACWTDTLEKSKLENFIMVKCVANVSSGTYIRQLVQDIGGKIGIPTVTYSIKRTKVGEFNLDDKIVIQ